jgi:3-deoxy-D-manno-octulosonic-acid transferase
MSIIYDLTFLIVAIFYLPIYLLHRKFHKEFLLRLGFLPKDLNLNNPVWIHAVSVGEVMTVRRLIEELKIIYPDKRFVISTVTPTGNKIAKGIAGHNDLVTYLPLDFSFITRRVIDKISPSLVILAETEFWPNFISYLYRKKIPVLTVNGRISDASYRGYRLIRFLLRQALEKISLFCMQTQHDAKKLMRLGVSRDKIKVTGNMKFDVTDFIDLKTNYIDLRSKLYLNSNHKLFVAGSTHPQEEEIILGVYKELHKSFPDLRLLIAPRHPERAGDIAKITSRFGFKQVFVSNTPTECSTCISNSVFILDTVGELINFYAIADIVFVAGSLVKKGGHNILEPASFEKPIIFGPYMFNFGDIAELFLTNNAAIMIRNQEELKINIVKLLNNPQEGLELGRRAKGLILQNQGATKRNVGFIKDIL